MKITESNRLIVRRFEESDLPYLIEMLTDADTVRFTGFKVPQTEERIKTLLGDWIEEGKNPLGVWALSHRQSGDFVGWVMLKKMNLEVPELGYMIYQAFAGNAYATEASLALLDYARNELNINKVVAETTVENLASIRVLEKAGMKRDNRPPRSHKGNLCFVIEL